MEINSARSRENSVNFILPPRIFDHDDELCRYCWKCYREKGLKVQAKVNYDEVMSGHVGKLLASLIGRWSDDESMLGYCGLFGADFKFILKWTESRMRRRRRRRKFVFRPSSNQMLHRQSYSSSFSRSKK